MFESATGQSRRGNDGGASCNLTLADIPTGPLRDHYATL
jgi:hypothetical protein